jgi:hypothetical protein
MEAFFDIRTFGNINSYFILRILDVSEDILISFPFEEIVTDSAMTIIAAIMQGCP